MSRKSRSTKKDSARPHRSSAAQSSALAKRLTERQLPAILAIVTIACLTMVAINLRANWAPLPWLFCLATWAWYWLRQDRADKNPTSVFHLSPTSFLITLFFILMTAASFRLYRISDLPLGPYIDEILTLLHALELQEKPFDLFGHTPLTVGGWVETPNLYLYFNLLIAKLFGVSYTSMKLISVIPGIAACGFFFYAARVLFDSRTATWTTLLFAAGHWPVRLSRYGWDASFMIMTCAAAIALLWHAKQRDRQTLAYFGGLAAGLSLYSYAASRIAVVSLVLFLLCELVISKEQRWRKTSLGFFAGLGLCAFPLLCYYLTNPNAFWVRANELSVFNHPAPFATLAENIWRHALMFHVSGGAYARDNFPGTPMLDPLTGTVFLVGLFVAAAQLRGPEKRFVVWLWLVNFIPGVFSVSQEGAPYVYRVAAIMVPTFLIAGVGLQWATEKITTLVRPAPSVMVATCTGLLILAIAALNFRTYFGLEAKNYAAMRTMAYEARLIGAEIASDPHPTIVLGSALEKIVTATRSDEPFGNANPAMKLPLSLTVFAITAFAGRYDIGRSIETNLNETAGLIYMEHLTGEYRQLFPQGNGSVIFAAQDQFTRERLTREAQIVTIKPLRDLYGTPIISVATVSK